MAARGCIKEYPAGFWTFLPKSNLVAFFQAYFDESGKHQQNKVVSFSGFLESDWTVFEDEWRYLLRRNKLPALHVSATSLKATDTTLKLYSQFINVIRKNIEHGFSIAIDVPGFAGCGKTLKKFFGDDPHYCAFHTVLRDVVKYAMVRPEPSVSIVCDDVPEKACACYKMFDRMRQSTREPENRKVLKSIAFADDTFYPQLQAADLFSWVSRAECLYRYHGEKYSLRDLYTEFTLQFPDSRIAYTAAFWDANNLADFDRRVIAAIPKQIR